MRSLWKDDKDQQPMKLRIEPPPEGYVGDKAAVLEMEGTSDFIVLTCENASDIARKIVRAVNRDHIFDAMVAALTPFRSGEMGKLLLDAMFSSDATDNADLVASEAEKRMRRLIGTVDAIFKVIEQTEERKERSSPAYSNASHHSG